MQNKLQLWKEYNPSTDNLSTQKQQCHVRPPHICGGTANNDTPLYLASTGAHKPTMATRIVCSIRTAIDWHGIAMVDSANVPHFYAV